MSSVQMKKKQKGQGMVEYIIIVALIGLAAIGAFTYFGGAVRGQGTVMTELLAGSTTNKATETGFVTTSANNAKNEATQAGLANYSARDANTAP
jgi:Flp pilus assembly pilin Flp